MRRRSIRKRLLITILLIAVLSLVVLVITSAACMFGIREAEEKTLVRQLNTNFSNIVTDKTDVINMQLQHYEGYIELAADYIEAMYRDKEALTAAGTMFYAPVDTDEYMLTRGFASEEITAEKMEAELLFFSNAQNILEPIARENEGVISTIYIGTNSGLLVSYDKYSYLSVPEDGKEVIYDYPNSVWYRQSLENEGVFYSGLYMDSQGRGITLTIGSAFYDETGEYAGAVCADFDITSLYNEMRIVNLGSQSFTFIMDRDEEIISPEGPVASREEYTGLEEEDFRFLSAGGAGMLERDPFYYFYAPIGRIGWTLCSRIPKESALASLKEVDWSISMAWLAFSLTIIGVLLAVILVSRKMAGLITRPIELLGRDMEIIAEGDLEYKSVAVRNDEIGDMSFRLNEMVEKLKGTLNDLFVSQRHEEELSELANKDALTGVRNRTSYDQHIRELDRGLENGETGFAVVMADLNYLKVINDSYGHDKGDAALRGCCRLLCGVYSHSPVFRIGGDEFVVLLKGTDFDNREKLSDLFETKLKALQQDESLEPWERISVATGCAEYDPELDDSAGHVAERADRIMYDRKKEMKSIRE